jgi:4-amino-4-deoxy-L-arabinose transferase-like glycosyltransferase
MRILYLLILLVSFVTIYSSIFDKKVSLVGDNASYYILGTALATGEGYTNIQHLEKEAHYHYPPGYPVIIAGVAKLFSNDIITIKICNGILFLGAILLLFFIVKQLTQNDHIAFAVSLLSLLNYHLLTYSTIMMSEIPFLFFSMLSVWLFLKIDFTKPILKNGLFFGLIICVAFSFYIRSIALALLVSLVFYLTFKKKWHYAITLFVGCVLLYLPWMFRNQAATGNTYISQLALKNPYQPEQGTIGLSDIFERVFVNLARYITKEMPSSVLHVEEVVYSDATATFWEWFLGFLVIASVVCGLYKLQQFRIFVLAYVIAFFGILLLWPSVWYGIRFVLPLLPLLIFLAVLGGMEFLQWFSAKIISNTEQKLIPALLIVLFVGWLFVYGYQSISKLNGLSNGVFTTNYQNYFALADWIKENAADDAVTVARKEGLFYLFSQKNVTNYQRTLDLEAQIEDFKRKKVTYVVVDQLGYSSTSKYLLPAIDRYPNKFKIIQQLPNPNTYLMKFQPALGYWGNWENDKRNGFGTYVWEDGQKYEGNWKDNLRHGEGTVYFQNGESLSGVWQHGKLNGEVIKKNTNGVIVERSIYQNNEKVQVIYATD